MFSKTGKLFGKISIIDIAVLAVLVVLVLGIALRFGGNATGEFVTGATYECVVKVENVRSYTVDALRKGGEVYNKTTKEYIGTITNVTQEDASDALELANGSHAMAPMENRYHAYVTIAFTGKESAEGYFTAANQQISPGCTLLMNAKHAQCEGIVVEVGKEGVNKTPPPISE